jgi:hypothetical protein
MAYPFNQIEVDYLVHTTSRYGVGVGTPTDESEDTTPTVGAAVFFGIFLKIFSTLPKTQKLF